MWPRIIEVMLGCWLMISPFVFRIQSDETFLWINDLSVGASIILIALVACREGAHRWRLLQIVITIYLWNVGMFAPGEPPPLPPSYQNYVVLAFLLLVTSVLPTRATLPPRAWQEYYENRRDE